MSGGPTAFLNLRSCARRNVLQRSNLCWPELVSRDCGGTSALTRALAATTELLPTVTPRRMMACAPTQASSFTTIGPLSYSNVGESKL